MNKKGTYIIILLFSIVSLYISLKTFYNMAIYVDEANTSPSVVLGGEMWVFFNWVKFALLAVIAFLATIKLIQKEKRA